MRIDVTGGPLRADAICTLINAASDGACSADEIPAGVLDALEVLGVGLEEIEELIS